MNTYFEFLIKLKFSRIKRELLIFPLLWELLYCVCHVKETYQLCTRFFVKDSTVATTLNKKFNRIQGIFLKVFILYFKRAGKNTLTLRNTANIQVF